jgi:hypothetical protein
MSGGGRQRHCEISRADIRSGWRNTWDMGRQTVVTGGEYDAIKEASIKQSTNAINLIKTTSPFGVTRLSPCAVFSGRVET